jgi:hypothetical protein
VLVGSLVACSLAACSSAATAQVRIPPVLRVPQQ